MKKISLIIPVYNVSRYVAKSLRSALSQTYPNIEYIIVNDCSSDNSMDVVRSIISEPIYVNKNVSICEHSVNQGLSAARNTGINNSTGEYVFFMDSDDTITDDCIEKHVAYIDKYEADITDACLQVVGGRNIFYEVNSVCFINEANEIMKYFFQDKLHFSACNKLIKRSLIVENKIYFKEQLLYEDWPWSFMIYQKIKSIVMIPDKTYNYIIRENSITTAISNSKVEKQYESKLFILNILKEYILKEQNSAIRKLAIKKLNLIRFKSASRLSVLGISKNKKKQYYILLNNQLEKYNKYSVVGTLLYLPYSFFFILTVVPYCIYKLKNK